MIAFAKVLPAMPTGAARRAAPARRLSLRTRLVLLVIVGALPLLAYDLVKIHRDYRTDREAAGKQALDFARSFSFGVASEIDARLTVLQVLADSGLLAAGAIDTFRARAERVVRDQFPGSHILVLRDDGQELMNTAVPPGAPLPRRDNPDNLRRVLETGMPAVAEQAAGGAPNHPAVAFDVPVPQQPGRPRLVLSMEPGAEAFDGLLRRIPLPGRWVVSIVSGAGTRLARVPFDAALARQPVAPAFRALLGRTPSGITDRFSAVGAPVLVAHNAIADIGWTVVVTIPQDEITDHAWRSAWISVLVGLGVMALGLLLANLVSRGIAGPIAALRHLAAASADGRAPQSADTGLQEVDEVGRALLADARQRQAQAAALARHAAALERSNAALERSNKDLDDFAYIASHDLKEPLRGLSNNAKFLLEDHGDRLPEDATRRLHRMGFLAARMENLINDLLYFSRLAHQDLAVRPTDLNAVIADIIALRETAEDSRTASIAVPKPLPEVVCDRTRVAEVFRNLISNALKYNESPQKRVEIGHCDEVQTPRGRERDVFYVKDNGIGIAPEFHDDIFKIFKRLNAEEDDKKGTGVGLTFVRKIIERHGGRIWLSSTPGEGTTFFFTFQHGSSHASPATGH
jgi:signal transduction histidine kinase